MSIKNNIDMVREELSSEEKFFEKTIITERFVKKYKKVIITAVIAIIIMIGANVAYDLNRKATINAANEALNTLIKNPSDKNALAQLKSLSPELHDLYLYSIAIVNKDTKMLEQLKDSKAMLIGDLSEYELAQSSNNIADLNSYTLKQDAIYKDLAQIQSAILLMKDGQTQKAHDKLQLISKDSSLFKVAEALLHYGVK